MATAEIEVPTEGLPSLADANRDISRPISTPYKRYWLLLGICGVLIAAAGVAWAIPAARLINWNRSREYKQSFPGINLLVL